MLQGRLPAEGARCAQKQPLKLQQLRVKSCEPRSQKRDLGHPHLWLGTFGCIGDAGTFGILRAKARSG
jgi:hypothetical protein